MLPREYQTADCILEACEDIDHGRASSVGIGSHWLGLDKTLAASWVDHPGGAEGVFLQWTLDGKPLNNPGEREDAAFIAARLASTLYMFAIERLR